MWRLCKPDDGLPVILAFIASLWLSPVSANQAINMEGIHFPARQVTESGGFKLRGAGILTRGLWFDIYAAAYYAHETQGEGERLEIHYFVPIAARQIRKAAEKHLVKQHGAEFLGTIKPGLDRLHDAMVDVNEGDNYALTLHRNRELILEHNGQVLLRLPEPELAKVYLNLWLGDKPLDDGLRSRLLGRAADS